jgi:GT2 family glycosyltransferase
MATDSPPPAPAVVAVVVTCDPGPWFAETMASLADQDYPNLSVLVIDAGSRIDPTPVVAASMPGAFVRRLETRVGFGRAVNEVLEIVEGASHFLLCHDDVALAPDALRRLVEEGFRSNAGIVSPKYVKWDAPDRLLAVGLTTDKVGARRNLVEPGELDQEQHDSVREVLVAPGGVTLVRADLFIALGGFDPVVDSDGEDMDLSWRARLAGARVMVAPSARVRHLEAASGGDRLHAQDRTRLDRNRYRTLLTCYRATTLLWIVPLAVFWALGEAATLVVQGRGSQARVVLSSLRNALADRHQLRQARSRVQRHRTVGDRELRALQVRGNARLRVFVQGRVDDVRAGLEHQGLGPRPALLDVAGPDPDADGRAVAPPTPERRPLRRRLNILVPSIMLIVLVIGTRSLFGKGLPQIGTLPNTSAGWSSLWRSWWSAWQPSGLGVSAPGSPGMALLGLVGTVLFGAVGTLEHVVVLGPLVVGPIGAYRLARHWGSPRGQLVAAVTYALVPLPYNALAGGHFDGLLVYAGMPWVLSLLLRVSAVVPVATTSIDQIRGRLVLLGLLVAAVTSVAPSFLYVVPLSGLALLAGSLLTGRAYAALRLFGAAVVASVVAFVVLVPWSFTVVAAGSALNGPDRGPAGRLGLGQVLRFHTGPFGGSWLEWLILGAAALPLLVGREWRLEWAARFWTLALVFFAFTWAGSRGWVPALPPDVLLAPAAAALAGSAALGVVAFEQDLPGYNFGWRQAAAAAVGLCLIMAALPWFGSAGSGRWDLPSADASTALTILGPQGGDYRILWVGDPAALPLQSRGYEPGFAYATSTDGEPSLSDDFPTGPAGSSSELATDLKLVQGRLTTKMGHLLAPAGVRYVVIPNHVGPAGSGGPAVPVPGALIAGLGLQTDLQALVIDPNYTVYDNSAWAPIRSVLPASATAAADLAGPAALRQLQQTDLSSDAPVLTGGTPSGSSGTVPTGQRILDGSTRDSGWRLSLGGHSVGSTAAFGWAGTFQVPALADSEARARLTYSAPILVRAGYVVQIVLWIGAIGFVVLERRRRSVAGDDAVADPEWFAPLAPPGTWSPRAASRRPVPAHRAPAGSEESDLGVWDDV